MRSLIINFKNYPEILGDKALTLAQAAETVADQIAVELVLAPPHPMLGLVAAGTGLQVFSQSVSESISGTSTGAVVVEAVRASGAVGTLLNHSEAPIARESIAALLPRLRMQGMRVCLCAKTAQEATDLSSFGPEYLAIEPPELIGSGVAVSRAKPELLRETVSMARRAGYTGKILCGAGIVDGRDVEKAVALGVEGVLVASSVVKAKDWVMKISELAQPLV